MVLPMTIDDRIEVLQNTFYLLSILYEECNMLKFLKEMKTLNYDRVLIPDGLVRVIEDMSRITFK